MVGPTRRGGCCGTEEVGMVQEDPPPPRPAVPGPDPDPAQPPGPEARRDAPEAAGWPDAAGWPENQGGLGEVAEPMPTEVRYRVDGRLVGLKATGLAVFVLGSLVLLFVSEDRLGGALSVV